MRKSIARALGLVVLLSMPAIAQSTWCLAPGDSSESQLRMLTSLMTPSDSTFVKLRESLGLSGLDTTDMQLVMDDSICVRVDSAMMRAANSQNLYPRVVYRLGPDRFGTFLPGYSAWTVFFIDDHYELVVMVG